MKKNIIVVISLIILISLSFFIFRQLYNIKNKTGSDINISEKIHTDKETIEKGNFGEISRIFKEESITNTGCTILLINRTNIMFNYSHWFVIEKKVNNEWKLLKAKSNIVIDALGRSVRPNSSIEMQLDWTNVYGKLKSGEYRLVLKDISGESNYYYMKFSIK